MNANKYEDSLKLFDEMLSKVDKTLLKDFSDKYDMLIRQSETEYKAEDILFNVINPDVEYSMEDEVFDYLLIPSKSARKENLYALPKICYKEVTSIMEKANDLLKYNLTKEEIVIPNSSFNKFLLVKTY